MAGVAGCLVLDVAHDFGGFGGDQVELDVVAVAVGEHDADAFVEHPALDRGFLDGGPGQDLGAAAAIEDAVLGDDEDRGLEAQLLADHDEDKGRHGDEDEGDAPCLGEPVGPEMAEADRDHRQKHDHEGPGLAAIEVVARDDAVSHRSGSTIDRPRPAEGEGRDGSDRDSHRALDRVELRHADLAVAGGRLGSGVPETIGGHGNRWREKSGLRVDRDPPAATALGSGLRVPTTAPARERSP